MPLADDLRSLLARSQAALNESHDYFTYTKRVWRLLQDDIRKGRKVSFRNPPTRTRMDERGLLRSAEPYLAGYLTYASFQHFVSLFEDFFFDLLRLWLAAYPGSLSHKQLELGTVLKAADKDEIIRIVVDKELNELKYRRVAEWFAHLDRLANLGCPSGDEIEVLAEIKASRDILVHNQGVVSAVYLQKAGSRARFRVGEKLVILEPYHRESWELIKKVIGDIAEAAIQKA